MTARRAWQIACRYPDAWAAAVLVAISVIMLATAGVLRQVDAIPECGCVIAISALVAWRRRYPLAVAVLTAVVVAVPFHTRYAPAINNSPLFVPALTAVFLCALALGSECAWQRSLPGLVALIIGINLTGGPFNPLDEMLTIGPWAAGLVYASRRGSVELLELRARELDAEREIFAMQSVQYERARIARELHDIVAHCVSLIVVQANAGERLTHHDPASAAEAFDSIGEAARQAEIEIDRLVELLGSGMPAAAPTGLRIVEELVRRAQASGLHVTCEFTGDSDSLGEPSAEAAYRLVQEGVTNAVKHAPGAPIRIVVRGRTSTVEVEVSNGAATGTRSGLESTGGGRGLAGMRERVLRCGGTFGAGPTAGRGWRIAATLPRRSPFATGLPQPSPGTG